jgi:hypothetical protein
MVVWRGVELLIGKVLFATLLKGALSCADNGKDWIYRTGAGKLFFILHLLGSM